MLPYVSYTRAIRHGVQLTQIHIDSTLEELAHKRDNLSSAHAQATLEGQSSRHVLSLTHGPLHAFLEKAELGALRNGVTHGQLDHMVSSTQGDHIVEEARLLDIIVIFEMELFRLKIVFAQWTREER